MQGANVRVEEDEEARGEQQRNNSKREMERTPRDDGIARDQAKMKRDPGRLHYNQQKQGTFFSRPRL